MRRPNVLLLYTDQQRWDALAAAGNPHIRTPNLDRLAAEGALFENAFCNNPVCMPSRQSMLSGQYPSSLGCCCNGIAMREDVPTLATVLKPCGYHAATIGKLHFLNHSDRDHRECHPTYGFDTVIVSDEPGCYDDAYIKWVAEHDGGAVDACRVSSPPACVGPRIEKHGRNTHQPYVFEGPEHLTHSAFVADQTIAFLRARRNETFFAIAGFFAPHAPLNPPQRFVDMYNPADLPLPVMNEGENQLGLSDEQWRVVKAYYYALVSHVDDQIGRILAALDELGLSDNTIVVFTSDHGEHLGDHGRVQKGPPGLDSCVHVPLLVRYPGRIARGRRVGELVEAVDLAPTLVDWCGVQPPPIFQGRSFRPLLEGRPYEARTSVFIEYRDPFGSSWKAVRTHAFKYCRSNTGAELLFDLAADPYELASVAGDPACAAALHTMRDELLQRWFSVERQYPRRTAAY
ncbi:MAG: sulfatase-like hydrolase/transferase [Planctomycetes bacterium]|nr:sulfatase-like hydrolase/transferase [Planctomycetota bacterium]